MTTPTPTAFDIARAELLRRRAEDALASAREYDAMPGAMARRLARRCRKLALQNRYEAARLYPRAIASDVVRQRVRAGVCAACGGGPRAPRSVLCGPCRGIYGYCPACAAVEPRDAFYAPSPSRAARGAVHGWHKPCHRREHRKHATPEAARAALAEAGRRLNAWLDEQGRVATNPRPVYAPDGRRIAGSVAEAAALLGLDTRRLYEGRMQRHGDGWVLTGEGA
jgi:hypothetical protein